MRRPKREKDQWKKPDPTLKKMYVLMGVFADGNEVVPVKLEVKEFRDKKRATLLLQKMAFQLPIKQVGYGSMGIISYDDGVVNISGKKFSDVFEEGSSADTSRSSRSLTPEQRKLLDAERRAERLKEDNEFLRRLMESGKTPGRERGRGEDKLSKSSRIRTFPCGYGFL